MEDKVEVIEIWQPVKEGGEAVVATTGQNLKLVAFIVDGYPIRLEKDWILEKRYISKEEAARIPNI